MLYRTLSEMELTMLLPWTHLRPASTIGNLEESIMNGTFDSHRKIRRTSHGGVGVSGEGQRQERHTRDPQVLQPRFDANYGHKNTRNTPQKNLYAHHLTRPREGGHGYSANDAVPGMLFERGNHEEGAAFNQVI